MKSLVFVSSVTLKARKELMHFDLHVLVRSLFNLTVCRGVEINWFKWSGEGVKTFQHSSKELSKNGSKYFLPLF